MMCKCRRGIRGWTLGETLLRALMLVAALAPVSQADSPIRIGFGTALTGDLAANGKAALLVTESWREEVNQQGGLLGTTTGIACRGRPVAY